MSRMVVCALVLAWFLPGLVFKDGAAADALRKFDEFGDVNCEVEYARLDNLAVQLQQEPNMKAVIVFFGGRRFRGKLPRRGDAAARAARIKPYLVQRRGIPAERVAVIDGGYTEAWHVEVWIIPLAVSSSALTPVTPIKDVRFRKGKPKPHEFECGI